MLVAYATDFVETTHFRKIRAPIKIISALPPPKKPKIPPPLRRGIFWTWVFFLQKERIFPGAHEIDAPISGPRIADKNLTDTRIFLIVSNKKSSTKTNFRVQTPPLGWGGDLAREGTGT